MTPKLSFVRTFFAALCVLFAVSNTANAFSSRAFFGKRTPSRAVDQPQTQQNQNSPVTTTSFWTRFMASNTFDSGSKRVLVKERPRVLLDPKSGKITEISSPPNKSSGSSINPWNFVKETFYSTADAVQTIIQKESDGPARPVDGYSSTVEKTILKSSYSSSSPGERLMKEYQERNVNVGHESSETSTTSLFNKIKGGFYSTVDGISSFVKPKEEKPLKSPLQSYKPVVQPTLATSTQVKDALADLKSSSPAKRIMAQLKIRDWEEEQERRKRDVQRQETAESLKAAMYSFGDAVVIFVQSLGNVPVKLNEAAVITQEWIASVPTVLDNTVKTVSSIPDKVDQTVEKVQTTVETSIETTKKAVENVQALPGKIQKTVQDTQRGVDETFTNVKVLVGVEEKKPVPPQMPPPKPRTAEELTWDLAGGVATVVGKAAWFVTVGAAKLSFAGAKLAYGKLTEKVAEERTIEGMDTVVSSATVTETPKAVTVEEKVKVSESASKPKSSFGSFFGGGGKAKTKPAPTVSHEYESKSDTTEQAALDQEVSEALALAEKAMALADETLDSKKKNGGKSDLDIALQKAREAAVTATKQAVEVEETSKS